MLTLKDQKQIRFVNRKHSEVIAKRLIIIGSTVFIVLMFILALVLDGRV